MEYVMYKKVITLISLSLVLIGCQHVEQQNQPSASTPDVTIDFKIPPEIGKPPEITAVTPATTCNNLNSKDVCLFGGQLIKFSFPNGTGSVLLIIEHMEAIDENGNTVITQESPFVNGEFVVRLSNGHINRRSKRNRTLVLKSRDTEASFKYTIVDVSGRPMLSKRPPLDPYIRVGPRVDLQ